MKNIINILQSRAIAVNNRIEQAFISHLPKSLESIGRVRRGSRASRLVRHLTDRHNFKAILGGNLALFVLLTGVVAPTTGALAQIEPEETVLELGEQPVVTQINVQYPVEPVIISQGYHFFHLAIDLDGVTGDPIRPIKNGRVVSRQFSRWAYGNAVLIDHGDGLQSFYAHLSKINVKVGDEVTVKTVIGEMGASGRSTGDHLHLEVYKNGRPVNPISVLGQIYR